MTRVVSLVQRLHRHTAPGSVPAHRPDLGPCLLWTGYIRPDGYGKASLDGRMILAHRAMYLAVLGPIPEDRPHLDHLCRVPACVRVEHLEPVTQAENNRRAWRDRGPVKVCRNGHPKEGENLRLTGRDRRCVECRRATALAYYHRTKAAQS